MFQALFEKCAEWLFPIIIGITIWYGLHYVTLAPRIIGVDQKALYVESNQDGSLPLAIRTCVKENITDTTLSIARLEASLYTATMKHIDKPFNDRFGEIHASIDKQCGISKAREAQRIKDAPKEIKQSINQGLNLFNELMREFR